MARTGDGDLPFRLAWELLLLQHEFVGKAVQRPFHRDVVAQESAVGLLSKHQDYQILSFLRQSHRTRLVNPLAKLSDTDGGRGLRCLPAEVIPPVVANHKMSRVVSHLAEHQRIGNVPDEWPDGLINSDTAIG